MAAARELVQGRTDMRLPRDVVVMAFVRPALLARTVRLRGEGFAQPATLHSSRTNKTFQKA
jgi:hypothetical protein